MADELHADPAALRQAAGSLGTVAERLDTAWRDFCARVEGRGDIFGDDMVGGLIGASYQCAHQIADESYGSVIDGLTDFGDGLSDMADSYDEVEGGNTDMFSSLYS
jgi:hypothetical protein